MSNSSRPSESCEAISMRQISLLAEDYGHEALLGPMVRRIAADQGVAVQMRPYSVRGGFGKVAEEFKEYVAAVLRYRECLPDLVIVATDANCDGFAKRRKGLQQAAQPIQDRVVFAIPDPHVERWLLLDAAAFKQVLGRPCKTPDKKCARDRYKDLLAQAVAESGATPLLGGMEYAEEIVSAMDIESVKKWDESLGSFLEELHSRFRMWRREGQLP